MRLDFFVKLKKWLSTVLSVGIKYSLRDLLLTSITMPNLSNLQSSNMHHIRSMKSALPLASAWFSKLWISFLKHLLDGDLCTVSLISTFSFLQVLNPDFVIYFDFTHVTASNTATDDVTLRSHIEYLTETYNILVLILHSKLRRTVAALAVFNAI